MNPKLAPEVVAAQAAAHALAQAAQVAQAAQQPQQEEQKFEVEEEEEDEGMNGNLIENLADMQASHIMDVIAARPQRPGIQGQYPAPMPPNPAL